MNQSPIVLDLDDDDSDRFLSYIQDSDKISKTSIISAKNAQDIEIQNAIYTDDVVSINIIGKYICILHSNIDI